MAFVAILGMVLNRMKFLDDMLMESLWTISNLDKKWKLQFKSLRTIKAILSSNCALITTLIRILSKIALISELTKTQNMI